MDKDLIKEVIKEMILEGDIYIDGLEVEAYSRNKIYLVLSVNGEKQSFLDGYELDAEGR